MRAQPFGRGRMCIVDATQVEEGVDEIGMPAGVAGIERERLAQ